MVVYKEESGGELIYWICEECIDEHQGEQLVADYLDPMKAS